MRSAPKSRAQKSPIHPQRNRDLALFGSLSQIDIVRRDYHQGFAQPDFRAEKKVRAARVQNETAPEKILNRCEKRFEKREKRIRKTIRNAIEKFLALSGLLKIFHRPFFTKF